MAGGAAKIVLGARSAVFAPIPQGSLGIVIVDEEHDGSYKQDQAPRYHGRDVAVRRAQLEGCPVVLGSATPSLESWYNATERDVYTLHELPHRVPGLRRPTVHVVDFAEERRKRRDRRVHLLGPILEEALRRTLQGGGQALLLLNRRGYANYIACPDHGCGWVMTCDDCDVTVVYHRCAVQRSALEHGRRQRGRERRAPALVVERRPGQPLEPAHREGDVGDLVALDALEDARAFDVARVSKACGEARAVLEVGALEAESLERDEGRGVGRRPDALPEPVAHGEVPDRTPQPLEVRAVQSEVHQLLPAEPQEPATELERRLGEGEDGPGEQLGRLQLVVQERVDQPRAGLGARGRLGRAAAAPGDAQLARTARPLDAARGRVRLPIPGRLRRRELGSQLDGVDQVPAIACPA